MCAYQPIVSGLIRHVQQPRSQAGPEQRVNKPIDPVYLFITVTAGPHDGMQTESSTATVPHSKTKTTSWIKPICYT